MISEGQLGVWPDRPPQADKLLAAIRALVMGGCPVGLTSEVDGALARADLDVSDIIRGFRTGDLVGPVTAGEDENEWVCTVAALVLQAAHTRKRELGIVTVVIEARSLLIAKVRVSET